MSHSLTSEPSRSESAAAAAMPPQPRPYRNDPYAQLPNAAAVLVCHDDDNDAAAAAAFATGGGIDDEDKNNSNNRSNYGDDGVASAQLHEASARDVRVGDTIAYECMTPHREWRVALGTVLALPAAHVLHVRRYDAVNATSLPRDPATETALRATAEQRGCLDVWHDRQALAEELVRVAAQEHATASQLFAARLQTRQKRDDAEAHMAASLEALDVARTNLHTVPQRQWREARTRSDVASDVQRLLQAVLLVLREDACTTSLADMQTVLRQPDFMQRLLACDCSERPLSLERRRRIVQLCEPELPPTPAAAAAAAAAASSSSTSNKRKSTTTAATSSSKATSVKKTKAAGAAGAGAAAAAKRKTTSTAAQQRRRRSSASSSVGGSGSGAAAGALRVPEAGEAVGTMTALDAALRRWVNAQFACAHATMQRERAMYECFAELQEQRVQLSAINDVRIHMSRLQEQMRELRLTIEHGDAGTEAIAAAITEQPAAAAAGEQQPAAGGAVTTTTTTRCATTVVVAGQIVAMRDGGEPPVAPLECLPVDTTFYRATASEAFCLRQQLLVNFGVVVCDAAGYVHLTPTQVVALRNVSYQANVRHDAKEMAQLLEQKAREEAELKDLHELLSELSARHTPLPHDEDEKAQLRQLIDDAEQRHEATLTRIADLYAAGRGAREITLASQRAAHTFTRLHFKMSGDWEALTSEPGRLAALKQALYADIMRILHIPLENISDLELRKGSLEAYFTVRHNGELDDKELQELINQDTFANLCAFYESVTFKKTYPLNTEAQQAAYDYMCRMEERKGHLPVSGMGVAQYVSDYYGPGKAAAASSSSGDDEDAGEVVDMSEFYGAEVRGDAEYCATRVRVAAVREDYDDVLVNLKDEYAIVFEELPRMPEEEEEEEEEEEAAVAAALDEAVAAPVLQQQEQELEEEEAVAAAYADHVRKGHDDDSEAAIAHTQDSLVRTGAEQGVQTQLGLTQMELTDDGHMHTMTATTAGNAAADQFAVELSTPPREAASKPLSPAEEHAKQHVEAAAEESATAMMQQQEHEHAGHDVRPPTPPQPSSAHHESPRELSPHEAAAAIAAAAPASAHSSHHTTPRAAAAATPKQATPRAAATPKQQSASRSTTPREATSKPLSPAEEHAKQHVEAAAEESATAMMQQQQHEHAGHDVRPPTPPQPPSAHHESPRELSPHEAAAAIAAAAPASAHSSHHTTPRAAAAATPKQATPRAAATPSNASVSSEAVVQQVCEEQAQHAAADAHAHGNATVEAQTQAATAAAFATVPDVDKDASEQREL